MRSYDRCVDQLKYMPIWEVDAINNMQQLDDEEAIDNDISFANKGKDLDAIKEKALDPKEDHIFGHRIKCIQMTIIASMRQK